jgi:hypothetical protein
MKRIMANLIEDRSLKDKVYVFKDRKEAGGFLPRNFQDTKTLMA